MNATIMIALAASCVKKLEGTMSSPLQFGIETAGTSGKHAYAGSWKPNYGTRLYRQTQHRNSSNSTVVALNKYGIASEHGCSVASELESPSPTRATSVTEYDRVTRRRTQWEPVFRKCECFGRSCIRRPAVRSEESPLTPASR